MKNTVKLISLFLVLLFVITAFAACGKPAETTKPDAESKKPKETDPRFAIEDSVPENLNYKGETVTFFSREDQDIYKYEIACEELLNNTLFDAIHYRNIDVENRLGAKINNITQIMYGGQNVTLWNNTLSTSVLTNTGDYDGAMIYTSQSSPLAKEGIYYNLLTLSPEYGGDGYFDFSKPWWNQSLVDELSVFGTLFFAGGDVTVTEITDLFAIVFNKDLFEVKFPDERVDGLYQIVRDGKWTVGKMTEYVSEVWDDLNSNGMIDAGDVVGLWTDAIPGGDGSDMDGWLYAMGLEITETNDYGEPELVLHKHSNLVPAYEAVKKLFFSSPGSLAALESQLGDSTFANGKQLFSNFVFKWGENYRESEVTYGVLPIPKFTEEQANYRTTFVNTASSVILCSNLPDSRATMLSAIIEVLSAESYKQVTPAYFGTVLQGHYSKDVADAEMYDMIIGSTYFTFGYAYSSKSLGGIGTIFRNVSDTFDIQSHIDSNKESWEQNLIDLLEALEAVS